MWRPIRKFTAALIVTFLAAPASAQTSADDLAARTTETIYRLAHLFEPPAQSITIPNTFVNGTVADATQVNANFTALSSNALNRNGGTMLGTLNSRAVTPTSDATYDVGTNVLRFRDGWFSRNGSFGGTLAVTGAATFSSTTSLGGIVYTWPGSQTANYFLQTNGSGTMIWAPSQLPRGCDVRLTLTSGTPVTTADVTGAATVYVTPFVRDGGGPAYCAFYDGSSAWATLAVAEVSVALGTITSALPYDIFCFNSSGSMACDAPVAWTNTTTRATALALQNNVLVKSGTTTRRYMGTFHTTSTTTTEDSAVKRDVWSYYNRVRKPILRQETTGTWSYNTATIRQAQAAAANQIEFVIGVAESVVDARVQVSYHNAGGGGVVAVVGLGLDSTTTFSGEPGGGTSQGNPLQLHGFYSGMPAAGRHFLSWNEYVTNSGTATTFYGNGGGGALTNSTSGIGGTVED